MRQTGAESVKILCASPAIPYHFLSRALAYSLDIRTESVVGILNPYFFMRQLINGAIQL